ncbi:MAG: alpha/beta hydrolase [Acidobacteriota bacterium]|nr:alpha/beta hydrolase [Acidobacteriota bacterium]
MLAVNARGNGETVIFFLHLLGGSGREWADAGANLEDRFTCVYVDLQGFGDSADVAGYGVETMADAVADVIAKRAPRHWMIAGHSMGAKVAAAVARRAEDGDDRLKGLVGMVLVAGSPPSPEPMADSQREKLKSWFAGDAAKSRREAHTFIQDNLGRPVAPNVHESAILDVLRMNRAAWLAWLDHGSREDWSARIGVLKTPALIVAGQKDEALGPDAQRTLMLPHFAHARVEVLAGAKHLLPMECPEELATLISAQMEIKPFTDAIGPVIDSAYRALIDSDRVSALTWEVLMERAKPDAATYGPRALSVEELATLRAVMERVLPQPQDAKIDLAARVDHQLAEAKGDGWRYALLPPDAEAYQAGLRTLDHEARSAHARPFGVLEAAQQDELLTSAAKGDLGPGLLKRAATALGAHDAVKDEHLLNAEQMRLWFEDLRGAAVAAYVSHPATLGRMGYSGIADGDDASTAVGFTQIGLGQREAWEPFTKRSEAQ